MLGTLIKTMNVVAQIINTDLKSYPSTNQFTEAVISQLDLKCIELLLSLPSNIWIGNIKWLLGKRLFIFFSHRFSLIIFLSSQTSDQQLLK